MALRTSSGQRLAIWIGSTAVVLLVLTGLGLKIQWDARYRALEQAKADWPERFHEIRSERYDVLVQVAEKLVDTSTTPEQIIGMLGGNIVHEQEYEIFHKFIDDDFLLGIRVKYGREIDRDTLEYRNTGVIEYVDTMASVEFGYIIFSALWEPMAPKVVRHPAEAQFESACNLLAPNLSGVAIPWTILLWIIFLVFAWFFIEYRPLMFAGAIWLAVLSGLIFAMNPEYELLTETTNNDLLFWVVLMLLITAGAILWDKIESRPDPTACVPCGYTLRGNTTGECPECGASISDSQNEYLRQMT